MAGGIQAWNGLVAAGPPDAGMAHFSKAADALELAALAWYLEAGSRTFYRGLAALALESESELAAFFELLAGAEEKHLRALVALSLEISGARDAAGFPQAVVPQQPEDGVMEGGVMVERALAWARDRRPEELLEYAAGLETNSWDLYLRMREAASDEAARTVFESLAEEEKRHLDLLMERLGGAASP